MYLGDFQPGAIIRGLFNTRKADGTPITLAGTPALSVYKNGGTTESTAGVTLTVDFDSRTGLHLFVIDTSADGTFYATGSDFAIVLTAGTVDSVSVVGTRIRNFSLGNRTAAPTAAVNATAVRSELATELARVDVATSSRLASGSYIAPPSAASNASAVRTELTTELGRIDVATSTRLATAGYTAPLDATAAQAAAAAALTAYDPPTRTEATSDKDAIIAAVEAIDTSGGSGANALSVTVVAGGSAVPGAQVVIKSSGLVVAWGISDSNGELEFSLDDGSYTATVQSQPGYATLSPAAFTLSGDDELELELTAQSITPPVSAGICTVRFLVLDSSGDPVAGAKASASLDANSTVDTALVSHATTSGTTDENGIADLTLIQFASFTSGGIYRVKVSDSSGRLLHDRRVKVPTLTTLYAEDLLDIG